MALSPMTVSQPQCSAVHELATFSHVYVCKKTMGHNGEHFTILLRTMRHTQQPSRHQEREQLAQGRLRCNPQGRWPEIMSDGWQLAKAEWMAEDRSIRQAEGTGQHMAT